MRRLRRLAPLAVFAAIVLAPSAAQADWSTSGANVATATATSVNQAARPTVTKTSPTVSLSWAASTLANGVPVSSYEVRRHSGTGYTVVCSVPSPALTCTDAAPLMGPVTYGVVARIGASWVGPESDLVSFQYDTTAPATSAGQSAAANAAGWVRTDTTVTLAATDTESGVKSISYAVNGVTQPTVNGSSASVPVSTEGSTTISYSATDNVGNAEATKTYTVNLDKTAPAVAASGTTASGGTSSAPVTLSLAATDGGSGVASVSYRVGTAAAVTTSGGSVSVPIGANGTTSVTYWATDVAGNVSTPQTYTVTIATDTTKPVFGSDGIIGLTAGASYSTHDNSAGWADICNGKDAICAAVSDPGSGVAGVTYTLQGTAGDNAGKCWDGAAWTSGSTCSVAMTLAGGVYQGGQIGHQVMGDGSYTLTVVAGDAAGNQATLSLSFTTDSGNPKK